MMKQFFWLSFTMALLVTNVGAQPVANAPFLNIRLPVFNEFGYRIWDVSAASVRHLTEKLERFEATTIHLRMYAGDEAGTLELELFAPVALVDVPTRTVSGKGQLHAIARGVELFGNDWVCHGETKSMVIERDVVVTFAADLGNVLR